MLAGVRNYPSEVYLAVGSKARGHLERALAESCSVAECPDLAGFHLQFGRLRRHGVLPWRTAEREAYRANGEWGARESRGSNAFITIAADRELFFRTLLTQ